MKKVFAIITVAVILAAITTFFAGCTAVKKNKDSGNRHQSVR